MTPKPTKQPSRALHRAVEVVDPGGRPTKLVGGIERRMVQRILEGNYLDVVAEAEGIAPSTLHLWRQKHPRFSESIRQALALAQANKVTLLHQAAEKGNVSPLQLDALKYILARRWPRNWSEQVRVALQSEVSALVADLVNRLPPEALEIVNAVVEERMAGQSGPVADHL